jgi:hypothetical protein
MEVANRKFSVIALLLGQLLFVITTFYGKFFSGNFIITMKNLKHSKSRPGENILKTSKPCLAGRNSLWFN